MREKSEIIFRLASQGLSIKHIGKMIGLTNLEISRLSVDHPDITEAIEQGKANGLATVTQSLFELATQDKDLQAIKTLMVLIGGDDYRTDGKAQLNINNNTINLPATSQEAIDIIMNDPALIGSEGSFLPDPTK